MEMIRMFYYQINDVEIIKKAESILANAQLWYDSLNRIAQNYGFDRVVLKGHNPFHQYTTLELAIHESRLMFIDLDEYELVNKTTVHCHDSKDDLIPGIYYIFKPSDEIITMEFGKLLAKIGQISPKKEILSLICLQPNQVSQVFWLGLSDVAHQQRIIYKTNCEVMQNHPYCTQMDPFRLVELLYSHDYLGNMAIKEKDFNFPPATTVMS